MKELHHRRSERGAALLNPEGNPCYFTFELVLTDTDEVLYISMQVEPGQMITNITLNRALPAGRYNAELRITTASLQDGSAMNGANVVTVKRGDVCEKANRSAMCACTALRLLPARLCR